jgi:hypothetical protein
MMTRRSLMLSAPVLAGMTRASSVSAQDKDLESWKRSTWQMTLKLDTPNLVPPAVQWTLLDKDPVPGFGARVKKMQGYKKQLERVDDEAYTEQKNHPRSVRYGAAQIVRIFSGSRQTALQASAAASCKAW